MYFIQCAGPLVSAEFPLTRIEKLMCMDEDVRVSTSTHTHTHSIDVHVCEAAPHVKERTLFMLLFSHPPRSILFSSPKGDQSWGACDAACPRLWRCSSQSCLWEHGCRQRSQREGPSRFVLIIIHLSLPLLKSTLVPTTPWHYYICWCSATFVIHTCTCIQTKQNSVAVFYPPFRDVTLTWRSLRMTFW